MLSNLFIIFAPLVAGYLLPFSTQKSWVHGINQLTSYLVFVILFLLGLSLSGLDNLGENLKTILSITLTFFCCIGVMNFIFLRRLDHKIKLTVLSTKKQIHLIRMLLDSIKLIATVSSGLLIGQFFHLNASYAEKGIEWALFVLLFFIGIQLKLSGLTFKQIILNVKGMQIALSIMVSSWIGGLLAAWILNLPISQALTIASGFGWYSLSGIIVSDAYGPVLGASSFFIELLRELVALLIIPVIINKKPCTAIGYAGATAMDFTLPVIQITGGIHCVSVAIVSGFILSLMVPVLMLMLISISG